MKLCVHEIARGNSYAMDMTTGGGESAEYIVSSFDLGVRRDVDVDHANRLSADIEDEARIAGGRTMADSS